MAIQILPVDNIELKKLNPSKDFEELIQQSKLNKQKLERLKKKALPHDETKLNAFQKNQLLQIGWWLKNIQENVNDSIQSLIFNCASENRLKQAKILEDQSKMVRLILQVKLGKTLLQGFNYKNTFKQNTDK